jgi:hypothetical protein
MIYDNKMTNNNSYITKERCENHNSLASKIKFISYLLTLSKKEQNKLFDKSRNIIDNYYFKWNEK